VKVQNGLEGIGRENGDIIRVGGGTGWVWDGWRDGYLDGIGKV
jgi:hypothetical protein